MKAVRYTAILTFAILFAVAAQAQLRLSLTVSARPSPYISDWASKRETAILTITNTGSSTVDAKLRAKVTLDDALKADTKTGSMPLISVPPGVSTYFADQILPPDAIAFYGDVDKTAMRTGMLPAGVYQICVDLVAPSGDKSVSQPACKNFQITSYQLPVLQLPEDKKSLGSAERPTFRWTPVIPAPSGPVTYRLAVFEVLPGQAASNLLMTGMPLFERDVVAQTQLLWPPDFILPEGAKTFVWSVQALDETRKPVGEKQGWAEPFTFTSGGTGTGTPGGGSTAQGDSISGSVRDFYSNQPIAGARVVFHHATLKVVQLGKRKATTLIEAPDSLVTTTDGEGRFSFTSTKAFTSFTLRGSAKGYLTATDKSISNEPRKNLSGLVVALKPNIGIVKGRVVDSLSNKGVNNIAVQLWRKREGGQVFRGINSKGKPGLGLVQDELVATMLTGPAGGDRGSSMRSPGKSGGGLIPGLALSSAGSFSFDSVEGGSGYYIVVNDPQYLKLKNGYFAVPAQTTVDRGTLRLQPKVGRIEGWVKEEGTNKPLSGAQVYLYSDVGVSISKNVGSAGQLGNAYNAGFGNAAQQGNFNGFEQAKDLNEPFLPNTATAGLNLGGKTPLGSGQQPGRTGGTTGGTTIGVTPKWSGGVAWSPDNVIYGKDAPPTMPDSTPKYGPVITDMNGRFVFENVRINDPDQSTDRYAVWAKTAGYYDAYKNARLSSAGQTKQVTLTTKIAKGIIHGKVTSKLDDSPIGGARVDLQKTGAAIGGGKGKTTNVLTTYSNPDGTYTLFGIDAGSYSAVAFSKQDVGSYSAPGPIAIENGTVMSLNASIDVATGVIRGRVTSMEGDSLPGVLVHTDKGYAATTFLDGSYILPNVPLGAHILTFTNAGFYDSTKSTTIAKKGDTVVVNMKMFVYKGSVDVVVMDSITNAPLVNAKVSLAGPPKMTTVGGITYWPNIPIGQKTLSVVADTAGGKDYRNYSTNVTIAEGLNSAIVVKLVPGGRISGKVENSATLAGVDSAKLTVEGAPGISALAGPDGTFTLRNVPAGVPLKIKAARPGFKTASFGPVTLAQGESLTGIVLSVEPVPLQTLYGFKVEVDSLYEKFGKKYVKGKLYDIPENVAMKMQSSSFKFPFNEIEIDNDYKAAQPSYEFDFDAVPITMFGMKAKLTDSIAFLRVKWIDSLNAGMITGNKITIDKMIPTWIPGAKWAEEKVTWAANLLPPAMYSDGTMHTNLGALGINATGTSVGIELFGFKLTIDYSKSKFDAAGIKYFGSMKIPGIPNAIGIENLHIALKDPETGSVKFVGVTVKTTPPITMNLGVFKLTDSTATWNEQGFKATGMIELTALGGKKFGFKDLWIGPTGDFLGVTINPDPSNNTITVLGQTLTITSLGFGTSAEKTPRKFFHFSGKLKISVINNPIEFQDLKYYEDNEFTGTIAFNQSIKLFTVFTVQLQSVEFSKDAKGKFIFVKGGIKFEIPMLQVQVGNFRFYENGQVNVEQIGLGFTAGPVQVSAVMSWSNNVFEGSATLIVQPVLSVSASFRYASGNDWWIKIKANIPPVPLGPFTLVGIAGELGYNYGYWTFGFGGSITVGNAKDAIKLDLYVKVTTSAGGPIIQGTAQVIVMSGTTIGTAEILLDFPNKLFTGNIQFGWNKKGVTVQAQIDIAVKEGQYWFVGAGVQISLLDLLDLNVALYIAKNYSGYMHTLPVAFHPNNSAINGFHLDAKLTGGWGEDGDAWHLDLGFWAYLSIDWELGLAGGFKVHANGAFDLWVIGGEGEAWLEAAVQLQNNCLKFQGNAGIDIKLWTWPCGSGDSCGDYCFPTGGVMCFDVSVTANYQCNSGWDFDVNW